MRVREKKVLATLLFLASASMFRWAVAGAQPGGSGAEGDAQARPRYAGVAGCTCHATQEIGDAFGAWVRSGHARAWVVLQGAQARRVAEAVGVEGDPQKSDACLSCHAGAARVDSGAVDPTFRFEDGVQCESCHGPAGDHAAARREGRSETRPGLTKPGRDDCLRCHREKPGHAVLKREKYDVEKAWRRIAHPFPGGVSR